MATRAPRPAVEETRRPAGRLVATVLVVVLALAGVGLTIHIASRPAEPIAGPANPAEVTADDVIAEARDLMRMGRPTQAVALLSGYGSRHPDNREVRLETAEIFLDLDQPGRAEPHVAYVLAQDANWPMAQWLKGRILEARNDPSAADWYTRAAGQPNAGPAIWGRYGMLLMKMDKVAPAKEFLEKAYANGQRDPSLLATIAAVEMQGENLQRAATLLAEARALAPRRHTIYLMQAECLRRLGQPAQAALVLEQALELKMPELDRAKALVDLGRVLQAQRLWQQAGAVFARAAQVDEVRGLADYDAANCFYIAGQYARAMEHIDAAASVLGEGDPVGSLKKKIEDARFGPAEAGDGDWFKGLGPAGPAMPSATPTSTPAPQKGLIP